MINFRKQIRYFRHIVNNVLLIVFFFCGLYACASLGTPSGGPYDEAPPRFLGSTPEMNSINFKGNRVEIEFNELIQLDKPSEKVIITPPQKQQPVVRAMGRKIRVEFLDSLIPNTTYTIDFTNSIVDNNEKNVVENFSFAFSTGTTVDSLEIGGILLNAENLEPMPNILIGLHTNMADSAFTHEPFVRTSKTNDRGMFKVRNVSHGTYRIYALKDVNRNYKFDQAAEDIAFLDSLFIPGFVPDVRYDTLWKDSLTVDTIHAIRYNRFVPDDLVLMLFNEQFERQYLIKSEREQANRFSLFFSGPSKVEPQLRLLNSETDDWYIREWEKNRKTVHYWIKDSTIYQQDSLFVEVRFQMTDSLNQLVYKTDTLTLFERRKAKPDKKDKKGGKKMEFLGIAVAAQPVMDVCDTLRVTFAEPLVAFDTSAIIIEQKKDTLWLPKNFTFVQDSLNPYSFYVNHKWEYGTEYNLRIDSAVFTSIYHKINDKQKVQFKFKTEEEYGHLYMLIDDMTGSGFGELLGTGDKPVKKAFLKNGELAFLDIKPGKYYVRYIDDKNGNGKWDTGNYSEKNQPENVYYYPEAIEIRQNFEVEQPWTVKSVPVEKQKPIDITKNKPEQKKKRQQNEENNVSNQNNRNTSGRMLF